eukprot:gene25409-biopygen9030
MSAPRPRHCDPWSAQMHRVLPPSSCKTTSPFVAIVSVPTPPTAPARPAPPTPPPPPSRRRAATAQGGQQPLFPVPEPLYDGLASLCEDLCRLCVSLWSFTIATSTGGSGTPLTTLGGRSCGHEEGGKRVGK